MVEGITQSFFLIFHSSCTMLLMLAVIFFMINTLPVPARRNISEENIGDQKWEKP
jgi:hypothetical protein